MTTKSLLLLLAFAGSLLLVCCQTASVPERGSYFAAVTIQFST